MADTAFHSPPPHSLPPPLSFLVCPSSMLLLMLYNITFFRSTPWGVTACSRTTCATAGKERLSTGVTIVYVLFKTRGEAGIGVLIICQPTTAPPRLVVSVPAGTVVWLGGEKKKTKKKILDALRRRGQPDCQISLFSP